MATKKPKQLTVAAMKKKDTQYNQQKQIHIDGYVVNVDTKFRPTKVEAMIDDFREMFNYLAENKLKVDVLGLLYLYMIKHFTDLTIPDDPTEQLLTLNIMIDNEYIQPIVEAFDQDEVAKVQQTMNVAKENYKQYVEQLKREYDEAEAESLKELAEESANGVQ